MKNKIIAGFILGITTMAFVPVAIAQTEVEDRIRQMEEEISKLKALVEEQNEQNQSDITAIEESVNETASGTQFTYGGFIKVDGMWSDYDAGPRPGNIGDEILVPSLVPVGGEGEGAQFDSHVKTSRFNFKTSTDTEYGQLNSFIELDFLSGGGDERVSNSTNPRIRHAFLSWDYAQDSSLLVGQTWSTFFNVGVLPESVEFIGPTSGTIFNRQTQLRWTKKLGAGGSFMLAAENPSTSLAEAGREIANSNFDDNSAPDIVARYNGSAGDHSYAVSAIGRQIAYDDGLFSESKTGFAVNLAGKYVLGNGDDIRYSIATGNLGRYIALNAFRDGGIDADGNLDLTSVTGGYISYRHIWSDKLRSTIQYAYSKADLANGLSSANTESVSNLNLNLMYSATDKLTIGGAIIEASRELENGTEGDLTRLQLTAKYGF